METHGLATEGAEVSLGDFAVLMNFDKHIR